MLGFVDNMRSNVQKAGMHKSNMHYVPTCERQDFKVGQIIGQGAFAVVHRGKEAKEPHRDVAIKIVRCQEEIKGLDDSAYELILQAMDREIEAMEAIGKHPSIVPLVAKDRDGIVIIMELGSSDLHTVIKTQYADSGLPAHLMKKWAQGICEGVAYIHASGYVHQDLKSSNIIVFDDRTVKVGDFGLVREKHNTMRVDREICTLWYRAPELLLCECTYSHKIDEWSIGVILLEMVMGGPPFRGDASRTCDCQKPNHRNFNSDQVARIFLMTGSPAEELIKDHDCKEHLFGWPKLPRTLERNVGKMMVVQRFRASAMQSHSDMECAVSNWKELIAGMLELDPLRRWTCKAACEKLTNMHMAENEEGLARRSPTPPRKQGCFSSLAVSSPKGSDDSEWRFETKFDSEESKATLLDNKRLAQDLKCTPDSRVTQAKFPQKLLPSSSSFQKRPTTVSSASSPSWSRMLSSSFTSSTGVLLKTSNCPHLPPPSPCISGNPKLRPTRPTVSSSSSPSRSRMLSSSFSSSTGVLPKTSNCLHLPHPSPCISGNPKLRPTRPLHSTSDASVSCSPVKNRLRSPVGQKSPTDLLIKTSAGRFVRKDKPTSSYTL